MFYACGTKPLPDELFPATQAPSLFPVDDNRAGFRRVSFSHGLSSLRWVMVTEDDGLWI
jgi:hypothetical protein